MQVHRTMSKVWRVVIAMLALFCTKEIALTTPQLTHTAHGHIASGVSGPSYTLWDAGAVKPGERIQLPGAVYFTVFSDAEWEMHVSSTVSVDHDAVDGRGLGRVATGVMPMSVVIPDLFGDLERRPLVTQVNEGAWLIRGVGDAASGPIDLGFLYDLYVSWDDPSATTMKAEISATLSQGDRILTAYVEPSVLPAGEKRPIHIWYFMPSMNGEKSNSTGKDVPLFPQVHLLVLAKDGTELARISESVGTSGWQSIAWEDMPRDGLVSGEYQLRVVSNDQLLGRGWLRVVSDTGQTDGLVPLSAPDQALSEDPVPDLRMSITASPVRFAERSRWTVTVINPTRHLIQNAQVQVCLPPGVIWLAADVPADGPGSSVTTCHTHLLGSVKGRSETSFSFEVTADQDVLIAQRMGLARAIDFRLSGIDPHTGSFTLLHTTKASVGAEDPVIDRPVAVTGRAYIDINGSGQFEPGEPILGGAAIIADGATVGTTDRSGRYRVTIPPHTKLLWVDTARGIGLPQMTEFGSVSPFETMTLDLPVRAFDGDEIAGGRAQASVDGGLWFGAERRLGSARLNWTIDAPRGAIAGNVDLGAPESLEFRDVGFHVTGHGETEALTWEGELYSGLPRTLRAGMLRPSMPVERGFRFGLQTVLPNGERGQSDESLSTMPNASPGGALVARAEVGHAQGDVWSCTVHGYEGEWLTPDFTLKGSVSSAFHERVTAGGVKTDHAVQKTAQLNTSIVLEDTYRWPLFLEVSEGVSRKLAPSCGLSPHEGRVWRVIGYAPPNSNQEGVLQSIEISGGRFQGGEALIEDDLAGKLRVDVDLPANGNEEARVELALRFRSLGVDRLEQQRSIGLTLTTEAAVQFGKEITGEPWVRPALRLNAGIGAGHDLQLELGPGTLYNTTSTQPSSEPGRLQVSWRLRNGPLRPWIRYEKSGFVDPAPTGEWGIQVDVPRLLGQTQGKMTAQIQLSRAIRKASTLDTIALRSSLAGLKAALSWSARTPFQAAVDRVVWDAELGYESARPEETASSQGGCACSDFRVDYVGVSLQSEWTPSGSEAAYQLWAMGRSPFGKYRLSTGTRFDGHGNAQSAYDTTALTLLYPLGPWQLGSEWIHKRDRATGASRVSLVMAEVRRRVTSEITALSTITLSRTEGHEQVPDKSIGGQSTWSVRRSIGLDWAPALRSDGQDTMTQPVAGVLRIEVAWTDEKPPELIIGFSLPRLW